MKNKKFVALVFTVLLTSFVAGSCLAISSIVDTSAGSGYADGNYTLDGVRNYAVYIMQLILSVVGVASLVMFVYGGVTFLISAGNPAMVTKGIDALKAAVIGLLITFASVLIINLFFQGLGVKWEPSSGAVGQTTTSPLVKLNQATDTSGNCTAAFPGYNCVDTSQIDLANFDCKPNYCGKAAGIVCCKSK